MRLNAEDMVTKTVFNGYGRSAVPAQGTVSRATPKGRGIRAQCHVVWSDYTESWEYQKDLT
jgi:hypothetical protein